MQWQVTHIGMSGSKRLLEIRSDFQMPIKVKGIIGLFAECFHRLHAFEHFTRNTHWIVNNDFVATLSFGANGVTNKFVNLIEVIGGTGWAGEYQGEGEVAIVGV